MGSRTRIRWTNVARLAAGAIACTALVAGVPALLERPKPPPLPDDIGLTQARHAPPPTPTGSPRGRDHAKPRHEENPPTGPSPTVIAPRCGCRRGGLRRRGRDGGGSGAAGGVVGIVRGGV